MMNSDDDPPAKPLKGSQSPSFKKVDFEDSHSARQQRRSVAIAEALKSRPLDSDPQGKRFQAAQKKAIAARRAENARLESSTEIPDDFRVSLMDILETAPRPELDRKSSPWRSRIISAALILTIAGSATLAAVVYLH